MLNSDDLINKVKGYNKFVNLDRLNKAYDFAVKAHSNQKRASGDPYSVHPIEVAKIISNGWRNNIKRLIGKKVKESGCPQCVLTHCVK